MLGSLKQITKVCNKEQFVKAYKDLFAQKVTNPGWIRNKAEASPTKILPACYLSTSHNLVRNL